MEPRSLVAPVIRNGDLALALSHSADQVYRLSQAGAHAVFSGHYHAGQFQLPIIGPCLSHPGMGGAFTMALQVGRPTCLCLLALSFKSCVTLVLPARHHCGRFLPGSSGLITPRSRHRFPHLRSTRDLSRDRKPGQEFHVAFGPSSGEQTNPSAWYPCWMAKIQYATQYPAMPLRVADNSIARAASALPASN